MRGVRYLVFVLAVQLAHLAVHQVLDGVDFGLHLLLGGLQLVLQFTDERFTAAAVQRSLKHAARVNGRGNVCSRDQTSIYAHLLSPQSLIGPQ